MTTLTRIDIQKIEEYWMYHETNKKQLKFREWELLNPHKETEVDTGISSGGISNTTQQKAFLLVEDKLYQNLKHIINVIDGMYHELDTETKTIVEMRYRDKEGNCYEWEEIADKLFLSRSKVLRKRNMLIDETAKRIGWV